MSSLCAAGPKRNMGKVLVNSCVLWPSRQCCHPHFNTTGYCNKLKIAIRQFPSGVFSEASVSLRSTKKVSVRASWKRIVQCALNHWPSKKCQASVLAPLGQVLGVLWCFVSRTRHPSWRQISDPRLSRTSIDYTEENYIMENVFTIICLLLLTDVVIFSFLFFISLFSFL